MLLEKAMRDYPAGTKFKSSRSSNETISSGKFHILDDSEGIDVVMDGGGFIRYNGKWAEIIPSEPEKTGLLDGKCAIQVNNEREFKLLMEYYYYIKQWTYFDGEMETRNMKFPTCVYYKDKYARSSESNAIDHGYTIIPFEGFAKEKGIDVPVYIMDSEDGVPLYCGDNAHAVYRKYEGGKNQGDWYYDGRIPLKSGIQYTFMEIESVDKSKAFSTKEAAEKWVEEQNKPKEVVVKLHGGYTVRVEKDKATFAINNFGITGKELEEIYQTYKSLQ